MEKKGSRSASSHWTGEKKDEEICDLKKSNPLQ